MVATVWQGQAQRRSVAPGIEKERRYRRKAAVLCQVWVSDSLFKERNLAELACNIAKVNACGASAGGLQSLETFVNNMTPTRGIAFVVVTHMEPDSHSMMPELIRKAFSKINERRISIDQ